jgi:hypothetical protein
MKIKDVFAVKKVKGDIGIEIELEGRHLPIVNDGVWLTAEDGSLKGGKEAHEYVLGKPVALENFRTTLEGLVGYFSASKVDNSIYAGTHLHINVQDITTKQLINFICAFIVLEEILVDWCGPTRAGNHFCLRSGDARWLIEKIRKIILEEKIQDVNHDNLRYSAINLKSVAKYGSLEFRTLDSTLDVERMVKWANVLTRIRDESIKYESPDMLLKAISSGGMSGFVQNMLGIYAADFLTLGWEAKVREGVVRAQDIAFCKDWNAENYNIFKMTKGIF